MARLFLNLNRSVPARFRGFRPRVAMVIALFVLAGLGLAARALDLQVLQHEKLSKLAERQSRRVIRIDGKRGDILDRNGNRLAASIKADSFYAHPARIEQPALTAFRLSRALNLPQGPLEKKLSSKRGFVWIKRQVTPLESTTVRALRLDGVNALQEYRRIYPGRGLAAPLLGFTGIDADGLEGLEYAYNWHLRGAEGVRVVDRDALGRPVLRGDSAFPSGGGTLRTTLHPAIQNLVEAELSRAVTESEATVGVAVVLHSRSGQILAMANVPGFNPNVYRDYDKSTYFNQAVTNGFEPGSTMKVLTAAAALEEGVVKPDTLFFCENGEWRHYDSVIHDTKPHGWLGLDGVIRVSSNICAAKIGLLLPPGVFHGYLSRFGFGTRIGLFTTPGGRRLAGEAEGYLLPVKKWTPVDHAAMAFGHGVLVSPLQMTAAINIIATGGLLLKPLLVMEMRDAQGRVIQRNTRTVVRRVLSASTTDIVRELMKAVVGPGGTGRRGAVPGYQVAGKTGTTEVYDIKARGYSKTRHIASFVGFVPADNPELTILVMVVEPKKGRYGGVVAAPVFSRIAARALPLLGVWPAKGPRRVPIGPMAGPMASPKPGPKPDVAAR